MLIKLKIPIIKVLAATSNNRGSTKSIYEFILIDNTF